MPRELDYVTLERIEAEARSLQANLFPALGKVFVGGEGDNPEAFIVGEAPGAQEEIKRRPFVGPCRVVRALMELADLYSEHRSLETGAPNAWITNVVKFKTPGNRNPSNAEVSAFRRLLQEEWHAVGSPSLIIPVGGIALSAIFGRAMPILKHAGRCHTMRSAYTGQLLYIWPMCHPAFGLRGGEQLQEAIERDWEKLGKWRLSNAQNK